jgi:hypothetical protein
MRIVKAVRDRSLDEEKCSFMVPVGEAEQKIRCSPRVEVNGVQGPF